MPKRKIWDVDDYTNIDTGSNMSFFSKVRNLDRRSLIYIGIGVGALITFILILVLSLTLTKHQEPSLANAIEKTRLMNHLQNLENIARLHNNSRGIEFGYNASVDYLLNQFKTEMPDWKYSLQYFPYNMTREISPPSLAMVTPTPLSFVRKVDFEIFAGFPGTLSATHPLSNVKNIGCEMADYVDVKENDIALIKRGNCTFSEKVALAIQANASAALIYNDGADDTRQGVFLGSINTTSIPVFSLTYSLGSILSALPNASFSFSVSTEGFTIITMNVILDTPFGDANNVIIVGSHLDSVSAGPGINDNGSGSVCNLELAIQMKKLKMKTVNAVRFAWWSAEEHGLVGSEYYVAQASSETRSKIALNINLDMLGSPNGIRGIFNGSAAGMTHAASETIQHLYEDVFNREKLPFEIMAYNNRSDYKPFVAAGIPANGVESGAEVLKTEAMRHTFGGLANTPYDPCYHQACDTVDNINQDLYLQLSRATAEIVQKLAHQKHLRSYLQSPK